MPDIKFPTETPEVTPALDDRVLISDTSNDDAIVDVSIESIAEIVTELSQTHNNLGGRSASDAHPASSITNTPAWNIVATDIQSALNELDTEKVAKAGDTITWELTITDWDWPVRVRENLIHLISTGVHDGCNLTITNATQFTITSGTIEKVDANIVPWTYEEYDFPWGTYTNNFLSSPSTYILIGTDGVVYQQDTKPDMTAFTSKAFIAVIANSGGAQVRASSRAYSLSVVGNALQEYLRDRGAENVDGNIKASANGANTSINTTPGQIWRIGANYDTDRTKPNKANISAKTPLSFVQYHTDVNWLLVAGSITTTMNTSQYNNGGTLATLATNKWCNHRLRMSPNGAWLMLFGSVIYGSLDDAIAWRASETWIEPELIADQAPVAWITVKGQTTNLSNTTDNNILPVSSFIGGGGGGGGGSGDMLAATYDPAGIAQQLVGTTAPQNITNKTIDLTDNTLTGTLAEFNSAITDADITPTSRTLTINWVTQDLSADRTWTISAGWFWTLMPWTPTRTWNTTFTVTWDVTAYVAKWMVIKWTESGAVKNAMIAIPSTYSSPNTTITIVGDTMVSIDAGSLKYCTIEPTIARFAIAGSIGATGTDVTNAFYATEPYRILGADMQVWTAGTTNNTTINLVNGTGAVTLTSPTLATTIRATTTPASPASSGLSLALNDRVQVDITAVQTTRAVDLYAQLYLFPTRLNSLT